MVGQMRNVAGDANEAQFSFVLELELFLNVGDPAFAEACADSLLENIRACKS